MARRTLPQKCAGLKQPVEVFGNSLWGTTGGLSARVLAALAGKLPSGTRILQQAAADSRQGPASRLVDAAADASENRSGAEFGPAAMELALQPLHDRAVHLAHAAFR
jgi:hypothetical protein